jgi:hypothetical protein
VIPNAGRTDNLVKSMCAGIAASNSRNLINNPNFQPVDGEDILTYGGGRKTDAGQLNARLAKCDRDFCLAENTARPPGTPLLECDEYPPCSMKEGGAFSTRVCIPSTENSRFQGPSLSRTIALCGVKPGDKLKVKIDGGCQGLTRRQSSSAGSGTNATFFLSGSDSTLLDPFGDGSFTYVGLSLGGLPRGQYDINFSLGQQVESAVVVNNDGDEYAT